MAAYPPAQPPNHQEQKQPVFAKALEWCWDSDLLPNRSAESWPSAACGSVRPGSRLGSRWHQLGEHPSKTTPVGWYPHLVNLLLALKTPAARRRPNRRNPPWSCIPPGSVHGARNLELKFFGICVLQMLTYWWHVDKSWEITISSTF